MKTPASSCWIQPNSPQQPPYEISLKAFYKPDQGQALIQVQAKENDSDETRGPATVVLVIDISGSMGSDAAVHGDDTSDGVSGLSQLDVVKHATRTVLESLNERDHVAIVAFASDVHTVVPLQPCTAQNRVTAWKAVQALQPTTCTNLYGGLQRALELVEEHVGLKYMANDVPANAHILLLTDGMPNVSPPRGELPTLQRYLAARPALQRQVKIATFGFGYSLKSTLLDEMAATAGGGALYAFIPDASFVGTVFCNALAHILATAHPHPLTLQLVPANSGVILSVPGGRATGQGVMVELPSLLYGQTLEVLVQCQAPNRDAPFRVFLQSSSPQVQLETTPYNVNDTAVPWQQVQDGDEATAVDYYFTRANIRREIIGCIQQAGVCRNETDLEHARALVTNAMTRVQGLIEPFAGLSELQALAQDLTGQISEAYSRWDWYTRWGQHYLLSLARAHILQQCSNFKDPGVQTYATEKFCAIRDECEAKFVALPPPQPSRPNVFNPVTSMRVFHQASNPCFASGYVRRAADGASLCITQVRSGDVLQSANGPVRVRCVVETPIATAVAGLVSLGDDKNCVQVTPWHPVQTANADGWKYPYELSPPQWRPCTRLISLVLEDGGSSFSIGGVEAVSLGHGIRDDPVASHDYLGTHRVIKDLEKMDGWEAGRVMLPCDPVMRDPDTTLIVGFKSNNETAVVN